MARLIDADELIELIDDDIAALDNDIPQIAYDVCLCTLKMVRQYIKGLPTIEAEPIKHGWWKNVHISLVDPDGVARYGRWGYECSICGTETAHITPYCPNCGARMDEVGE